MIGYLLAGAGCVGFAGIGIQLIRWAGSDRAEGNPDRMHAAIFGTAAIMAAAMVFGALIRGDL